ncbi:MAG: radical SAM family heme chaperone HemW [Oscillospiraceae bacterium]|nr:radical SAM family heme chaperone HemW [Oscillospiraceae bacterium]
MSSRGLYIHIPFCRRKCIYCDFYSLADEGVQDEYTAAVIRNIRHFGGSFDTVYFGGGTPSLMSPENIARILDSADIVSGAEISMEANPDSVTQEKMCAYKSAGVNRVSLGIQSFDDGELSMLSRLHDGRGARAALSAVTEIFDNVSADLMLGLPFQKPSTVSDNIDILSGFGVQHISAYMLKVEEGTELSRREELLSGIDDDVQADIYESAVEQLSQRGYPQYEISNFARPGFECRHNLKYWHCEEYLGIGPAAHSFMGKRRFGVRGDIRSFMASPVMETFTTDDNAGGETERMMLALRLNEGCDVPPDVAQRAGRYIDAGFMTLEDTRLRFTVKGMLVSNEILSSLLM